MESSAITFNEDSRKMTRVKKKVKALKAWYWSMPTYVVGTAMMVFLTVFIDPPKWMKLVLLVGPVLWWLFFIFQGLGLFFPKARFIKKWEEKKMNQFMAEAKSNNEIR